MHSHSILSPIPRGPDLEYVVCDYCGSDQTHPLAALPPLRDLLWPMHRLGAAVLNLGDEQIRFCQCQECSLVYMNPRLTEAAIARFYDTVYAVAGASELFESERTTVVNHYLDSLAHLLDTDRPHLLDIGCGAGQLLKAAQQRGWTVSGAELSGFAADHASQVLGQAVFHGDFRDMPLPPGSLDAITFIHVIEHLRAPVDFLRDSATLLKPGGVLLFDVPNVTAWEYKLARLTGQLWRGFIIEHLYYFTPAFIQRIVPELGLELVNMSGWSPVVEFPNPLRDIRQMRATSQRTTLQQTAHQQTNAPAASWSPADDLPALPPPRPIALPRRILRQANNYVLDTLAAFSQMQRGTAGNLFYVWARKTDKA